MQVHTLIGLETQIERFCQNRQVFTAKYEGQQSGQEILTLFFTQKVQNMAWLAR